jgi:capsid protein
MKVDKDKKTGTENKDISRQQGGEQEQNLHFDQVNDTYGSQETQDSEAAAEQQRKEALTERD